MPHTETIEFDVFLRFKTKELKEDFRAFKIKDMNRSFSFMFFAICVYIVIQRGVYFSDVKALLQGNYVFTICGYLQKSLFLCFVYTIFIGWAPQQMAFLKNWNRHSSFQLAYDVCFVLAGIYGGARLVTRVVQGTCPPDTSAWHSQVCNTNGDMKELPIETLLGAATYNLAAQVILRSTSPTAIFLAWMFNISLINVALYLVESPVTAIVNLLLLMLCMTSYEIERGMMQFFVNQKLAVASAETNTKLKIELYRVQMAEEKRALDSKREMVRHIAHEIRTPLNIVTVATDIILAELLKMESVPQFVFDTLNNCQEACAITCDIVNDLLNFEKLAAGLVTLEKMPTVLSTYVQRVLNPFYVSAGAKDLILDYQYTVVGNGPDLIVEHPEDVADVVEIDSVKMSSVLRNLLSNAIKFAKETIIVKVSVFREIVCEKSESDSNQPASNGHAVISVKDDGAGISSVNLSRLFQEGVQFNANELQKGGGSGFGLYIAKSIVDLHTNSRMWAESEGEGKGATFFVKLPLSDAVLSRRPSLPIVLDIPDHGAIVSSALDTTLRPLVILVVDDSVFTRRLTIQLLKLICGDTRPCTILEAADGQEAVACVMQSLVAPMLNFTHSRPAARPQGGDQLSSFPVSRQESGYVSKHLSRSVSRANSRPNSRCASRPVSTPTSGVNSRNLSRRNSFDEGGTWLGDEGGGGEGEGWHNLDSSGIVNGTRSLDNSGSSSRDRGGKKTNRGPKDGGEATATTASAAAAASGGGVTTPLDDRRGPSVVQIDLVFMDYNMPRMVCNHLFSCYSH